MREEENQESVLSLEPREETIWRSPWVKCSQYSPLGKASWFCNLIVLLSSVCHTHTHTHTHTHAPFQRKKSVLGSLWIDCVLTLSWWIISLCKYLRSFWRQHPSLLIRVLFDNWVDYYKKNLCLQFFADYLGKIYMCIFIFLLPERNFAYPCLILFF